MYRKSLCFVLFLLTGFSFADISSAPVKKKFLNNPAVANSRQAGSQLTFGTPKMTGNKGQNYYTEQELKNQLNNPTVANSRQAGSQLTFGEPSITGQKGQKYNHGAKHQNRPAVGSKQASDFIFNQNKNPLNTQNNNQ